MLFLKNLFSNIKFIITIPIIIIILSFANYIKININETKQLNTFKETLLISQDVKNLVHFLQQERGASVGYISSNGSKFVKKLKDIQFNTDLYYDKLIKNYKIKHDTLPYNFSSSLKDALYLYDSISDYRYKIKHLRITTKEAVTFYTSLNRKMLDTIKISKDASYNNSLTNQLMTTFLISNIKELSGIERAVLTGVFTINKFSNSTYEKVIFLKSLQNNFLEDFKFYANDKANILLNNFKQSKEFKEVERMRNLSLIQKQNFDVNPKYWFNTITNKITELKKLNDILSHNILVDLNKIIENNNKNIINLFFISLLFIFVIYRLFVINKNSNNKISKDFTYLKLNELMVENVLKNLTDIKEGYLNSNNKLEAINEINSEAAHNFNQVNISKSKMLDTLEVISMNMDDATRRSKALEESVDKISDIIELIKQISEQTNILSINATIEAVRAGESGRGFSVVADEVRRLAEITKEATQDIEHSIEAVKSNTKSMNYSTLEINESIKEAKQTSLDLENELDILLDINTKNINNSYLLSEDTFLNLTKLEHLLFKINKYKLSLNDEKDDIEDINDCKFGEWYNGKGRTMFGNSSLYIKIREYHRNLHENIIKALEHNINGNKHNDIVIYNHFKEAERQSYNIFKVLKELMENRDY